MQEPAKEELKTSLLSTLLTRFQGDFDNYNQVYADRKNGLLPRQGGGHEHFHVTLIPLPIEILPDELFHVPKDNSSCGAVVAAYYFDGIPRRIFRLRMYTLYCDDECKSADGTAGDMVKMKLHTFDPSLEGKLRTESGSALEKWTDLIGEHVCTHNIDSFKELERCDILWTREPDSVRHSYLEKYSTTAEVAVAVEEGGSRMNPVHAIMVNDHETGGVLLESQMMPGSFIRIQDELSLWDNELWVNDRGHDAESKSMVYGNWNGVPYQMTRVASLTSATTNSNSQLQREIVDTALGWTMGESWRTPEEYESRMSAIGGVSTRMNQSQKQNEPNKK